MAQPNIPDITPPSTRGQAAAIGITANYGTSQGSLGVGGTNNSVGGLVYNGVDTTNNFPKNQSEYTRTNTGGASFSSITSSANPASIQRDSAVRASEYTAQKNSGPNAPTTAGSVSTPASGKLVNFPSTDNGYVRQSAAAYYEVKSVNSINHSNGIQQNDYLVNDLTRLADDRSKVLENSNKKIDGAAQGANSEDKFLALGDNVQTATLNTLPGGVDNINNVGK